MMLRKLAVSLAVAGIIGTSNANALGLGEIKIHSALNEPLNAEIKLLEVRKLGPMQIQPRMADIDEFALAGLSKSNFLTDVSFQVKVNPDGSGLITMRSAQPVKEPFLNFLVEVNWPNGRLVREYTLLLDPPVFDSSPVMKPVQPSASSNKGVVNEPVRETMPRTASSNKVRVGKQDTLWSIVIEHRTNEGISAKKMMIALQRKNPHAFVDNNINGLREGVVLELPTLDEINKLNENEAALDVVRQASVWKNRNTLVAGAPKSVKGQSKKKIETASIDASESKPEEEKSAELKIVTPKSNIELEDAVATDQAKADLENVDAADAIVDEEQKLESLNERNDELEARLSESLENVDRITRENIELNDRLDAIQYELEKLREMLELKDKELTTLQNKVVEAEANAVPAPEEKPAKGMFESPFTLAGIGAAIIALLAALFFFIRRRKEEGDPEDDSALVQVPDELSAGPVEAEVEEGEPVAEEIVVSELEAADELDVSDEASLLENDDLNLENPEDPESLSDLNDLDDLDDLDLDMDMDLDLEEDSVSHDVLKPVSSSKEKDDILEDEEFDLGLDDALVEDSISSEIELVENESDALDDILGETQKDQDELAGNDDIDLGLDDLDFEIDDERDADESISSVEDTSADEGLDFVVEPMAKDVGSKTINTPAQGVASSDDLEMPFTQAEADDLDALLDELEVGDEANTTDSDIEAMLEANADANDVPMEDLLEVDEAEVDVDVDDELEALLAAVEGEGDEDEPAPDSDSEEVLIAGPELTDSSTDLEEMLEDLDLDLDISDADESTASMASLSGDDSEELLIEEDGIDSNLADELEADLDSELEALLSAGDDVELEELADEEDGVSEEEDFDELAGLNLLEGADEVETKLDLARAYMDMDDLDGAKDILEEIVSEGNEQQKAEAEALITSINEK